jgi:hypothetical protein
MVQFDDEPLRTLQTAPSGRTGVLFGRINMPDIGAHHFSFRSAQHS